MKLKIAMISLLVVMIALVYGQSYSYSFASFDDNVYVYQNKMVCRGLTLDGLRYAFGGTISGQYHPLATLSHMLDVSLFGIHAGPHRATNIFLHLISTLLLMALLTKWTGFFWRSFFVAAFFSLHPTHVESVVWIAERRDTLSLMFGLLSLLAYTYYNQRNQKWLYVLTLFLAAAAMLSKAMMVTLPCVMLLLDFWPLRRLVASKKLPPLKKASTLSTTSTPISISSPTLSLRYLLVEKIPFFAIAVLISSITWYVQKSAGAMAFSSDLNFSAHLANAIVAYTRYLGDFMWPTDLAILYPQIQWSTIQVASSMAILLVLSFLAWKFRFSKPYLIIGWCWFLGTLVPVIGLVQVGAQSMADRYSYLPSIGLSIAVVWLMADYLPRSRTLFSVGMAIWLSLATITVGQIQYWKTPLGLWIHTRQVTPINDFCEYQLGLTYQLYGRHNLGVFCYRNAIRLKPLPQYYRRLAEAYLLLKQPAAAWATTLECLHTNPNDVFSKQLLLQLAPTMQSHKKYNNYILNDLSP